MRLAHIPAPVVALAALAACQAPVARPSTEEGAGYVTYGPGQRRAALNAALASCGLDQPRGAEERAAAEALIQLSSGSRLPGQTQATYYCPEHSEVSQ